MNPPTLYVVHFMAPINQNTANMLMDRVLNAVTHGATEVRIHISSEGGSTHYGFALNNFLRSLTVPLVMHNIGNIQSMANVLFLSAPRRLVAPNARFLIHPLQWDTAAMSIPHVRLREWTESLDHDAKRFLEVFKNATHTAQSPLDVEKHLLGNALLLDAAAGVSAGMAHDVVSPAIPEGATQSWVIANQ